MITTEQANRAEDLLAVNPDAFVLLARRLAKPEEPISKTAQHLKVSRQRVYRTFPQILAFGFDVRPTRLVEKATIPPTSGA